MNSSTAIIAGVPALIIGTLFFVWVYQDNKETADLERDRIRLESMKFDSDFKKAWDGEAIGSGDLEIEIAKLKAELQEKELAIKDAQNERCERLNQVSDELAKDLGDRVSIREKSSC